MRSSLSTKTFIYRIELFRPVVKYDKVDKVQQDSRVTFLLFHKQGFFSKGFICYSLNRPRGSDQFIRSIVDVKQREKKGKGVTQLYPPSSEAEVAVSGVPTALFVLIPYKRSNHHI